MLCCHGHTRPASSAGRAEGACLCPKKINVVIRPHLFILGDCLYKSSAVAEMGDRSHKRHGPKEGRGAAVLLSRGGSCVLGPRLTQCGLGRGLPRLSGMFIHSAVWPQ